MKNPKKALNTDKRFCTTTINIPNELDLYYRELATKRGISKTHMIMYAMTWFKDYNDSIDSMLKMADFLKNAEK